MIAPVPNQSANEAEHRRVIADAVNLLAQGRVNSTGTLTIASGATSTVVANPNAHAASVPLLIPLQSTTLQPYVSARTRGSFTLSHAAPSAATSFLYVLLG